MSEAKIFIRERRKIEKGEKKPRFAIVGVSGTDLQLYAKHIRKSEIEQIAKAINAEVVQLQAGKEEENVEVDD